MGAIAGTTSYGDWIDAQQMEPDIGRPGRGICVWRQNMPGVWFRFVTFALLLAVVLSWDGRCLDSSVFFLLRVKQYMLVHVFTKPSIQS